MKPITRILSNHGQKHGKDSKKPDQVFKIPEQYLDDEGKRVYCQSEKCGKALLIDDDKNIFCPYCGEIPGLGRSISELDEQIKKDAAEAIRRCHLDKLETFFKQYSVIPPRLERATFETYTPLNESQKIALDNCRRYARNFARNMLQHNDASLYLWGPYGTGKSHLAYSIANTVMALNCELKRPDGKTGITAIFINVAALTTMIKATWKKTTDMTTAELLQPLKTCDLLVLDEVGAVQNKLDTEGNSYLNDALYEITDARQGKQTVYTSNHSPEKLAAHVNPRIYERILFNTYDFEILGESFRKGGGF